MFDPYRKWLGIPAGQRPPTYYQLLGIAPDESDPEIIEEAAIRQTAHLRNYQSGPHAEECKRLLAEIALARSILLHPARRQEYDSRLRAASVPAVPPSPAPPARVQSPPVAAPVPTPPPAPSPLDGLSNSAVLRRGQPPTADRSWLMLGVVASVLVLIVGGGVSFWLVSRYLGGTGRPDPGDADRDRGSPVAVAPTQKEPPRTPPDRKPDPEPKSQTEPKQKAELLPFPKEAEPDPKEMKKDPDPPPMPDRTPIPTEEDQLKAEKEIKAVFKTEYAKNKLPADLRALADKLLRRGLETRDDPAARYVMFREARDLALRAGDGIMALQAVEEIQHDYAVNGLEMKLAVLDKVSTLPPALVDSKRMPDTVLMIVEEAVEADQFDLAHKLLKLARFFAQRSGAGALVKRVAERGDELDRQHKDHERVQQALEVLKQNADDPDANLTVGKYLCLVKGDWAKGLPHLAQGGDEMFKALAAREAAKPTESRPQAELGDAWYDLAKGDKSSLKTAMYRRAYYWYRQAASEATGLTQERVEQRLKELNKILPQQPGRWEHLDITNATVMSSGSVGFLRINRRRDIRTRDSYSGPIEITLVARTEKDNLKLGAFLGAGLIFNPSKGRELQVFRPDGTTKPESGSRITGPTVVLAPNTWYRITWRITDRGMTVWVDDRLVFQEKQKYNLSQAMPVLVRAVDSWVDVRSLSVQAVTK
jgi:hypothetical protein